MTRRSDATLAAIVANVAECGTRWRFEADAVAPMRPDGSRRVTAETVERHMRAAGYAVGSGWMELTAAGLDAVEAVRAARHEVPTAPVSPCVAECALDPDTGWCRGCARTADEIAAWRGVGDAGKRAVLERVAERRQGASGGERVPALRWESHGGHWTGWCRGVRMAKVEAPLPPPFPAECRWTLSLLNASAHGTGNSGYAATPDAAKVAAESAFRAWCERAGLVAREGIVPGYKSAAVADPEGRRSAERRDAEGHVGEDAP